MYNGLADKTASCPPSPGFPDRGSCACGLGVAGPQLRYNSELDGVSMEAQVNREEMQRRLLQEYAVDTLPVPEFGPDFTREVAAGLPATFDFDAKWTTVVLKLDVSEDGRVLQAEVTSAPTAMRRRVVSVCFNGWRPRLTFGGSSVVAPEALQSAIKAALRNVLFRPATRGGRPVVIQRFEFGMEFRREQLLAGLSNRGHR